MALKGSARIAVTAPAEMSVAAHEKRTIEMKRF
jgi:hypothetical protein